LVAQALSRTNEDRSESEGRHHGWRAP
jgi:hypothetical protein